MKVIIFGLDGAEPSLVKRWIKSKELPNLKKLSEKGCLGKLDSVLPPFTGPAWVSFATGKNPGKHGIGDFTKKQGNYERRVINSQDFDDKRLWDILSDNNYSCGVINVPGTYPVNSINGVQISGLLTPKDGKEWIYPKNIIRKMEKSIGKYKILADKFVGFEPSRKKEYYKNIINTEKKRGKAIKYLTKNINWNLFVIVFNSTDFIQHFFWKYMENKNSKWKNCVKKSYQQLDNLIGEFIDENTNIFVISDHGFGPMKGMIDLNTWLFKKGYLKIRKNFVSQFKKRIFMRGWNPDNVLNFLEKFKLSGKPGEIDRKKREELLNKLFLSYKDIDWEKTKAYSAGLMGQIFINLENREPRGNVKSCEYHELKREIKDELKKMKDDKGNKIITNVYDKEEIYEGDKKDELPDLLVESGNLSIESYPGAFGSSSILTYPLQNKSGTHRKKGIFIASGPDIKNIRKENEFKLIDITPTVLYLMECSVPKDMDGKVLKDIISDKSKIKNKPIKYSKPKKRALKGNFTKEKDYEIKERLRKLGYVE